MSVCAAGWVGGLGERGEDGGRKCYSVLCLFNNFFLMQLAEQHIIRGLAEQA